MNKFVKIFLIFFILIWSVSPVYSKDDITEELREQVQADEVVLNPSGKMSEEIAGAQNEDGEKNVSDKKKFKFEFKDDDDNDGAVDNTEQDFEIFRIFDSDGDGQIDEDSLLGKVLHSKITRTDIPSFLYQNDLTFNFKQGPVSKIHTYGAYRGSINSLWASDNYSTEYGNSITQIGAYGLFKNPEYKFKVGINPIPKSGLNYLDRLIADAYIVNTSIPNHQLIAGYSRVQTGVEGGISTYTLPFYTRSQIARNFGGVRALGLKVIGNYQYVDYNISAGSSGRYITSGFPGAEFSGWVNFKPLGNKAKKYGKITIGGGYTGGHNRIDYSVGSVYIGYHHKKLWSNFEAGIANGYNGYNGISSNEAAGYAATVGWKFTPHFQLIGRVDQFDPNRNVHNDLRREYTIGLNWFIKGQALKVLLNYVYCDNQNMSDGHKIILATQILL